MKTVVVGNGAWGSRLARIVDEAEHYDVIGVVDKDPYKAIPLADELDCWASLRIDDKVAEAEAVIIATPPQSGRLDQIQHCIALGVPKVRVEKPVALDEEEINEIEKLGFAVTVGQTTIFQEAVPRIKQFVDTIDIKSISTSRLSQIGTAHESTPLLDLAPHDIAMTLLLLSTPECVMSDKDIEVLNATEEGLELQADDVTIGMKFSWNADKKERLLIVEGREGEYLRYDELTGELLISNPIPNQRTIQCTVGNAVQNELRAWLVDSGVSASFGCQVARIASRAANGIHV